MKLTKIFLFLFSFLTFQSCQNSTINHTKSGRAAKEFDLTKVTIDQNTYPVIILGGGIGGLTSAIYLGLAGYTPLVIEGETTGGIITRSTSIRNWPGEIEISGINLTQKIKKQAKLTGAKIAEEAVYEVDFSTWPYLIKTYDLQNHDQKNEYKTLTCIIAMGTKPNLLNVPGESKYFGKGVATCATCDGDLYKDQVVAVAGSGDAAITNATYLSKIAKKVFVFVRGEQLKGNYSRQNNLLAKPNIEMLYNTQIIEIKGDDKKITSISTKNTKTNEEKTFNINGVFLSIGSKPNTTFFENQLELDKNGYVKLTNYQESSKKGVFAIGDIVNPFFKQAIISASNGGIAAKQAIEFLEDVGMDPRLRGDDVGRGDSVGQKNDTNMKNKMDSVTVKATADKPHKAIIDNVQEKTETIMHINHEKELDEIIKNSQKLILIDFFAEYCPPCRKMSPIFEKLSQDFHNKVKFIKIDVAKNSHIANKYQVTSIPAFVFIDKKAIIKKIVGFQSYENMKKEIEGLIQK